MVRRGKRQDAAIGGEAVGSSVEATAIEEVDGGDTRDGSTNGRHAPGEQPNRPIPAQ
jgi:hypothetical protein